MFPRLLTMSFGADGGTGKVVSVAPVVSKISMRIAWPDETSLHDPLPVLVCIRSPSDHPDMPFSDVRDVPLRTPGLSTITQYVAPAFKSRSTNVARAKLEINSTL